LRVLYEEAVKVLLNINELEKAVVLLEKLRQICPNDTSVICQLIRVYCVVDILKARQICKELPLFEKVIESIDIDSIETLNWSGGSKYIKKTAKSSEVTKVDGEIKRKRKHKTKLPANCDPKVKPDPERWLPKWQRTTFKKRKNDRKHNVGKGTQGAVAGADVT
jgi:signal recognition particle subunit SRP72